MNSTMLDSNQTVHADSDGLPRSRRNLRNTVGFAEAVSSFKETAAINAPDLDIGRIAAGPSSCNPECNVDKSEDGLPHRRRKLRNVSSFEENFDSFSEAADKESEIIPIAIRIGARLRAARLAARMTQEALSAETGILQSAISEIEKGKGRNGPSCATVERIAEALGLRIDLVPVSQLEAAA